MKKVLSVFLLLLISSCSGNMYEPDPVGVGYDVNELKMSPCACIQVEMKSGLPEWLTQQA